MVFFVASACDWPSVLKWKLPIDVRFNWNLTCLDLCKMNLSTRAYPPPLILANPTALGPPSAQPTFFGETALRRRLRYAKVMAGVWKEFPEVSLIPNKIPWWFICNSFGNRKEVPLKRWSITTNSKNMLPRVQVYLHHKWDVGFNFFGHISLAIFRGLPFQGV